jgi:hypothetical protein
MDAPWVNGWSADYPAIFDTARALENRDFLVDKLGKTWFEKRSNRKGGSHPFVNTWLAQGVGSFIQINVFAEDLRLLEKKPGFQQVLDEFKRVPQAKAAQHVLHTAALFERSDRCSVTEFEPKGSGRRNDFKVATESITLVVEAKRLQDSEQSMRFRRWAQEVLEKVDALIWKHQPFLPQIIVVVKNVDGTPSIDEFVDQIRSTVSTTHGARASVRWPTHNLFLEPPPNDSEHLSTYRSLHFLCPKAGNENRRVLDRARTASKQLKECCGEGSTGILILGLTEMQEPHEVWNLIGKSFVRGRYSGISNAMLIRSFDLCRPPIGTFVDDFSFVNNPEADFPFDGPFLVRPLAGYSDILARSPNPGGIPAYRYGCVSFKVNKLAGGFEVGMPNILTLSSDMLD